MNYIASNYESREGSFKIQNSKFKIQISKYKIQNSKLKKKYCEIITRGSGMKNCHPDNF